MFYLIHYFLILVSLLGLSLSAFASLEGLNRPFLKGNGSAHVTVSSNEKIVFDNQSNFKVSGYCSHPGFKNILIEGKFVGTTVKVDCLKNQTWKVSLDFSNGPETDMSISEIKITHSPKLRFKKVKVVRKVQNCRAVAQFDAYSNFSRFSFESTPSAQQIPIWNFGDGSPDVKLSKNVSYYYLNKNYPYKVTVKHCPEEIERVFWAASKKLGHEENLVIAPVQNLFPVTGGYKNLSYLYVNNKSSKVNPYGLSGDAPDPDQFPALESYQLFYNSQLLSLPKDIKCHGEKLKNYRFYTSSEFTNPLKHPVMGPSCYRSIIYYDLYCSGLFCKNISGEAMDIAKFTSDITYYRLLGVNLKVNFPEEIKSQTLTQFQVSRSAMKLENCRGNSVPQIGSSPMLKYFDITHNSCYLDISHDWNKSWPLSLTSISLSGPITGVLNSNWLENAPQTLIHFRLTDSLVQGYIPQIRSLLALTSFNVRNNLLDIDNFPDPSKNLHLRYFNISNNPFSNTTGPYKFPDWTALVSLQKFLAPGVDFGGQPHKPQDLLPTKMNEFNIDYTGAYITSFDLTGLKHLKYWFASGNQFVGSLDQSIFGIPGEKFEEARVRFNGLTQVYCDNLFDGVWANRKQINESTGFTRFQVLKGNLCQLTNDQSQKISGQGAYVGEGLWSQYSLDFSR